MPKVDLRDKLLRLCKDFIAEHEITCAEGIYQVDDISLDSLEFIEAICDLVGYSKISEE